MPAARYVPAARVSFGAAEHIAYERSEYISHLQSKYIASRNARYIDLITAWETFSSEHPRTSELVETEGKDVFSVPELFADWGIYKAEQRED